MDAMYRAAMDAPSRVVLSESARRRKDRASAARARSKGYSASGGLTSTLLDRWWHEATGAPARRLPRATPRGAPDRDARRPGGRFLQPHGSPHRCVPRAPPRRPHDSLTRDTSTPRLPPSHAQRSSSPCGNSPSSIAGARRPVCSDWSSRRRVASCPSRSSRTSPPSTGAPSTRGRVQPAREDRDYVKRLGYATRGMYWKFRAFDVTARPNANQGSRGDEHVDAIAPTAIAPTAIAPTSTTTPRGGTVEDGTDLRSARTNRLRRREERTARATAPIFRTTAPIFRTTAPIFRIIAPISAPISEPISVRADELSVDHRVAYAGGGRRESLRRFRTRLARRGRHRDGFERAHTFSPSTIARGARRGTGTPAKIPVRAEASRSVDGFQRGTIEAHGRTVPRTRTRTRRRSRRPPRQPPRAFGRGHERRRSGARRRERGLGSRRRRARDRRVGSRVPERHSWQGARGRTRGGDEPRHAGRLGGVHAVLLENREVVVEGTTHGSRAPSQHRFAGRRSPCRRANTKNCQRSFSPIVVRRPERTTGPAAHPREKSDEAADPHPSRASAWRVSRRPARLPPPRRVVQSAQGASAVGIHGAAQDVGRRRAPTARGGSRVVEGGAFQARHLEVGPPAGHPPPLVQGPFRGDRQRDQGARRARRGARDARAIPRARVPSPGPRTAVSPSARAQHAFPATSLTRLPSFPVPRAQGGDRAVVLAPRVHRHGDALQPAPPRRAGVEQIVAKLDPSRADILLSQLRPAILQPAYILIRDRVERRLFFVIRGTHSVRDTVTSLTAHPRPHHAIGADGVPVLGYAHAGFLSPARWLAKNTATSLAAASSVQPRGSNSRSSGTASAPAPPCSSRNSFASSRGRSRAEPLRGRRVPRRSRAVVSRSTERELPTVHHHRRLSARTSSRSSVSAKCPSCKRRSSAPRGSNRCSKNGAPTRAMSASVRRAPRKKWVASRDSNDGIPAPRPRSRRAPGFAHVRSRRPAAPPTTWTTPRGDAALLIGWRTFRQVDVGGAPGIVRSTVARPTASRFRCDAPWAPANVGRARQVLGNGALIAGCVAPRRSGANSLGRAGSAGSSPAPSRQTAPAAASASASPSTAGCLRRALRRPPPATAAARSRGGELRRAAVDDAVLVSRLAADLALAIDDRRRRGARPRSCPRRRRGGGGCPSSAGADCPSSRRRRNDANAAANEK